MWRRLKSTKANCTSDGSKTAFLTALTPKALTSNTWLSRAQAKMNVDIIFVGYNRLQYRQETEL